MTGFQVTSYPGSGHVLASSVNSSIRATPAKPSREVFGYALGSSLGNTSWGYPSWKFSLLTTVAYFGIHITGSGVMIDDSDWQTWNSSTATDFLNIAHANGVKVLMAIVLQDFSPGTPTMCSGLANRGTTVLQVVAAMRNRGADGISVDYEGLNGTCPNGQAAREMMTAFVHDLRAALGGGAYLNVATYGSAASDPIGFFDVAGMAPYVDSFFVMAYDLEYSNYWRSPLGCSAFCLGPTAPLTAYYWNDTNVTSQYVSVVGTGKVILGVPYYGRKACVASPTANAITTSSVVADTYLDAVSEATDPSVQSASYATHRDVYDTTGAERWDTWYNPSLGCTRELYFDDSVSLGKKYDLVNQAGLRGVGIWTLNYGGGAPELWATISNHFATCPRVTSGASLFSPQPAGTQVVVNAAASGCSNPNYQFWLLPPAGTWTLVQPYSSAASFNWNTTGKVAGSYLFSVWVRNSGSTNSYDSLSTLQYSLTPSCAAITTTSAPAAAASIGTVVTISGAATGCPNPQYEFWLKLPSGVWTLAQTWSTSASFQWHTIGLPAGTYLFSVWTRDASSPNTYDAFSAFNYSLGIQACTAITASVSPSSPSPVGSTVVVTGSAAGCTNAMYMFWVLTPNAGWTLAQGYSTTNTLKWSTSGNVPGSYLFAVWARDLSSPGSGGTAPYTYDAFSALKYTLTPTCSTITAVATPAATASIGTAVTVSATAVGCPSPRFEFWLKTPSGVWTLAQAWSTSATFNWATGGRPQGTYMFSIWARDATSPNNYDSFSAFNYTLTTAPCSGVSVSSAPVNTSTRGTTVTITATATGCPNALYEFWVLPPGGSWTLVQAYSSNASFTWSTSGKAAGGYLFAVWARDVSSKGTNGSPPYGYDSVSTLTYTLS